LSTKVCLLGFAQPPKAAGFCPGTLYVSNYSSAHLRAGVGGDCPLNAPPSRLRGRLPRKGLLPRVRQPPKTAGVCTVTIFHTIFVNAPLGRSRERLYLNTPPSGRRGRLPRNRLLLRVRQPSKTAGVCTGTLYFSNIRRHTSGQESGTTAPSTYLPAGVGDDCLAKGSFLGFANRPRRLEFALARYTVELLVDPPPGSSRERLFQSASWQESGAPGPQRFAL
jgi:hypothetical protein